MIQYYQCTANKHYIPAASQIPKTCRSMAAKYNWFKNNLDQFAELNKQYLENDGLEVKIEATEHPFRIYRIKLYRVYHNKSALLEVWDNREALKHNSIHW